MKVRIIETDDNGEQHFKKCGKCGGTEFRQSTRSRYLTRRDRGDEHTTGITYDLRICDNAACGNREEYNKYEWRGEPRST